MSREMIKRLVKKNTSLLCAPGEQESQLACSNSPHIHSITARPDGVYLVQSDPLVWLCFLLVLKYVHSDIATSGPSQVW